MTNAIVNPNRVHPSSAAYCAGCHCEACADMWFRKGKNYRWRVARGGPALIDAATVAAHVRGLLAAGYSATAIAHVAGVDRTTVTNLADEKYPTTGRAAAERLQAVTGGRILDEVGDAIRVPAIGAARRIRALQALGWPLHRLAGDVTIHQLDWIANHPDGAIPAAAYRIVRDAYDLLAMRMGPSARTRNWARRNQLAPPLAWDDDEIDDPAATPRQPRATVGRDRERDGQILHLTTHGNSARQIAEKLGCSTRTVVRARSAVAR